MRCAALFAPRSVWADGPVEAKRRSITIPVSRSCGTSRRPSSREAVRAYSRWSERSSSVARAYGLDVEVLVLPVQLLLDGPRGAGLRDGGRPGNAGHLAARPRRCSPRLVFEIRAGLPLAEARRQLDALRAAPIPYPTWLRVIGVALFAGGFAPRSASASRGPSMPPNARSRG